jgi:hypothetical protein
MLAILHLLATFIAALRKPPHRLEVENLFLLRNHADAIAGIDLCLVPTLTFECLFVFLVVGMVDDSSSGLR